MKEHVNNIASIGKNFRNKVLFDSYENVDYSEFFKNVHAKNMENKNFLSDFFSAVSDFFSKIFGSSSTSKPPQCVSPTIISQSSNSTLRVGDSVTFSVLAQGTAPLKYQWKKNGYVIEGATLAAYSIPLLQDSDFAVYTVVVSNRCGTVSSSAITLSKKSPNIWGALIAGSLTNPVKLSTIQALKAQRIRLLTVVDSWTGSGTALDFFTNSGTPFSLNLRNHIDPQGGSVAFPTDLEAYTINISSILDKYKPQLVVVENEEDNPAYFNSSIYDYIAELQTAVLVAHNRGLKITNGGITGALKLVLYRHYKDTGQTEKAEALKQNAINSRYWTALENGTSVAMEDRIAKIKTLLTAYATIDIDYVNIHLYEPFKYQGSDTRDETFEVATSTIQELADFVRQATGKPVVSNETGTYNHSPELVKSVMQKCIDADLKLVDWYSGDGTALGDGLAVALNEQDGTLRAGGIAFAEFITDKY